MTIDFSKKIDGLVPAIVQDANTKCVLMLGEDPMEDIHNEIDACKISL